MANTITTAQQLPAEMVTDLFSKVKGHSTLAKLCGQSPMPFNGTEIMTFAMDGEASLVGEGGQKPAGDASFGTVKIAPVKFVYQHRVSDEFMKCSDEKAINYMQAFTDGFAVKMARALDIAAIHGLNPADATEASTILAKSFDKMVTQTITYDSTAPDDNLEDAVTTIQASNGVTNGLALAPTFGTAMAKVRVNGVVQYPEFKFGGNPGSFAGYTSDINNTVVFGSSLDRAIVGDFQNAFRWGYADNIPLEVIEYGDPDGQGDLKRQNQVCLRAESYIGWGILDAASFVRIVAASA